MMDDRVRSALRGVQPFSWLENMKAISEDANTLSYEEYSWFLPLTSVARLSNIDKHRRLTVAAWWPSLIHWTTVNGDPGDNQWRQAGEPPWGDGEVIAYVTSMGPKPAQVVHQFDIVIVDATNPSAFEFASRDLLAEAQTSLSRGRVVVETQASAS
jgi:hypothetical protein